ncbi:hypothetical protein FI667_g8462, partial [Globisporangium splendens]
MRLCAVAPLAWTLACPQVWATEATDVLTSVIWASTETAAYLGFHCSASASSTSPSPLSTSSRHHRRRRLRLLRQRLRLRRRHHRQLSTKRQHTRCMRLRLVTGEWIRVWALAAIDAVPLELTMPTKKLNPKVIIGHGDNFYWNGLGSDDVAYRFQNSFEAYYNRDSLIYVKWVNVAVNHDYGGAMFICGKWDNQFVECTSKADLLKQLDKKFTRQSGYKSPYNDRWQMPARHYVETIKDTDTGVTVDIFNVDTNAVTVHGEEQICCHCYGYETKYGGDASCNNVDRGHPLCAGGHTNMIDACLAKLEEWQADSLRQLFRDAKASTAAWKVVNSHYSPHSHVAPPMMQEWNNILAATGVHLFMNGHTHTESHDYGDFKTHFATNGAGGGIQSESIGGPQDNATNINTVWIGHDTPYGIFELYFGKQQMKLQFVTFDDAWQFKESSVDTVKGGGQVSHCWFIPKDGSKGEES